MIRVLLVDDQKIIRQGLQVLLEPEADIDIIGTADNGLSAIQQVEELKPEVVLLDIVMPEIDGIAATRVIRNRFPEVKILVLSGHDDPEQLAAAMQAGAQGYLLKNTPAAELAAAIRSVQRGYAQMGPGLVEKMMGAIDAEAAVAAAPVPLAATAAVATPGVLSSKPASLVNRNGNGKAIAVSSAALAPSPPATSALAVDTQAMAPQPRPNRWRLYLLLAVVVNAGLWGSAIALLQLKPESYASKWAMSIPSSRTSTNVSIPGIANASANSDSPFRNPTQDPREAYKFIVRSDLVLEAAAARLGITTRELGKPRVAILDNSSLMEFEVKGDTPAEAQERAVAITAAFGERLTDLRAQELSDRKQQIQSTLQASQANLERAQQRLAEYQATADISSGEQMQDVLATTEQLRQQRATLSGEQREAQNRLQQLELSLNLDADRAAEAFVLKSDPLFQQYFSDYSTRSAELTTLTSRFKSQSPVTNAKEIERDRALNALLAQGQQLLGRPVDLTEVERLGLGAPAADAREDLLQQLIVARADVEGLNAKVTELGAQVDRLEARRKVLAQQAAVIEDLKRDVQITEAVFSSTLATVDLTQASVSATYPEIRTLSTPNLPKKSLTPEPILVYLGTGVASFLVSLAICLLWLRSRSPVNYVAQSQPANYPALT
ncbi:MAG: response regulator [Cyanobacteria bacterium P01_F01_bin.33]